MFQVKTPYVSTKNTVCFDLENSFNRVDFLLSPIYISLKFKLKISDIYTECRRHPSNKTLKSEPKISDIYAKNH